MSRMLLLRESCQQSLIYISFMALGYILHFVSMLRYKRDLNICSFKTQIGHNYQIFLTVYVYSFTKSYTNIGYFETLEALIAAFTMCGQFWDHHH